VLRREIRVLSALSSTNLPHPRLIAACSSESVMGVVFYLTTMVDGFNPTNVLPLPHAADAAVRHEMGLTAIDALAGLGEIDYREVGNLLYSWNRRRADLRGRGAPSASWRNVTTLALFERANTLIHEPGAAAALL
jgi:aminoglycoside phosphotransferase (APT) family kinase protein